MQNRPVWFSICFPSSVPGRGCSLACGSNFPHRRAAARAPLLEGEGRVRAFALVLLVSFLHAPCFAQDPVRSTSTALDETVPAEPVVVSATRFDIPLDLSPASVSVVDSQDIDQKQIERVSDALREVPGLNVVQTGTPGQLTSVFMRGLPSEDMQVLLDGIPINQGLAGQFDFANLTTDDIDRIEIVRGPQSTVYGPHALAGVVQIFTKRGIGTPGLTLSSEGGTYGTSRETLQSDGKIDNFDYSIAASRLDTDNLRANNEYRNTSGITDVGWSPNEQLRIGGLLTYSESETGNPNTIFDPRPIDHFLTEKWFIAPRVDLHVADWWDHRLIFDYDHERQVNNPNQDGFVFATRALFERTTIDYQNNLRPTSWLTLTSGLFYNTIKAGQERPFVLFGPKFISDEVQENAVFGQATLNIWNVILVAGGRLDEFNQFGDVWTYRVASSYKIDETNTTLHSSVATGFSPPSSQDKIFGNNLNLKPEKDFGWDVGFEQRLWETRVTLGATYFHNDLSNVIGFNQKFIKALNLGTAETQGLETELRAQPMADLTLKASYTYLETEKTSSADVGAPQGSRLPRRPRNEVYVSASYLWGKRLRTTIEAKWVNARQEFNQKNFEGPNIGIADYSFLNFAAEYEVNPSVSIFGRIDNLTNEHYEEVFGFPALGWAAYTGVKLRF
jgi:vitamin B12 transporter